MPEFKVGQVWENYIGEQISIIDILQNNQLTKYQYPTIGILSDNHERSFTTNGNFYNNKRSELDLVKLIKDAE